MARRRPVDRPAGDGTGGDLVLPAELTFHRPGDERTSLVFAAERRAWLRAHGVDGAEGTMRILQASKRAHATRVRDLPALDRSRRRAEDAEPDDAA